MVRFKYEISVEIANFVTTLIDFLDECLDIWHFENKNGATKAVITDGGQYERVCCTV